MFETDSNIDLTRRQFAEVKKRCLSMYEKKMKDYGTSWRIMRPESLTDQIFIKANRIRNIETTGVNIVGDAISSEFEGIINYGVMALVQLELKPGFAELDPAEAVALYNRHFDRSVNLMLDKDTDYDEAWRKMRVSSFTDIILTKLLRIKQIEDNRGATLVSEGVEGNYMDIINYSIFALIKIGYGD